MAKRAVDDPTTEYARDVVSGRIVAGSLVKRACQRHLDDLESGGLRGLRFDRAAAQHVFDFFERFLCLPDPEGGRKPFALQPFQRFIVGSLFGWKGSDGFRRFRTCYAEMSKGTGKTPMAAGIGLYGLIADGEMEAEVYAAAVTREQASIAFRDARNMAEASPHLRQRLDVGNYNIAYLKSASFFRPVSSEHRGLDGKRPHVAIIDEVHEHQTPMVCDKIRAGTKARRQALILEITNSGTDRQSVCWHHHEYSRQVLEGTLQDDSWFAYVCTLDPCEKHRESGRHQPADGCPDCDDWRDESVWLKACPGLDTILPAKYLREQVREAQGMPSKEGIVRRLNFCQWTDSVTAWLPAALWANGGQPVEEEVLRGQPCWGGLDLASRMDLAALVLCFREGGQLAIDEPEDPEERRSRGLPTTTYTYRLLPYFWIPRDRARSRETQDRIPYQLWASQGLIRLTEGNVIDFAVIEQFIKEELSEHYAIEQIAFDPWNATQIATNLQTFGLKMVQFGQTIRNFNEPTQEFEALLRTGRLLHGNHAVLNWNAANASVKTDPSGNIRPVKPEHQDYRKVDGIVAAIMALAGAMQAVENTLGVEVW